MFGSLEVSQQRHRNFDLMVYIRVVHTSIQVCTQFKTIIYFKLKCYVLHNNKSLPLIFILLLT